MAPGKNEAYRYDISSTRRCRPSQLTLPISLLLLRSGRSYQAVTNLFLGIFTTQEHFLNVCYYVGNNERISSIFESSARSLVHPSEYPFHDPGLIIKDAQIGNDRSVEPGEASRGDVVPDIEHQNGWQFDSLRFDLGTSFQHRVPRVVQPQSFDPMREAHDCVKAKFRSHEAAALPAIIRPNASLKGSTG